ncbi:MAG TPA: LPS export ABC transporter permease LptF [Gammaproteobacteria bacterium]|nr:LPS export ABC transporter permease LptF [Gammaproteobacteria bacterium]
MIISRYLTKEVFNTLLAVTFVLLLVFISQQLVRYLSYAASGKIAANILFEVISFEIPNLLALLLPLGLFLGVILAYGRLYADNELRVMHACGLSLRQLMGITLTLAAGVTLIVGILMIWINPTIAADKQKVLASGSADNLLDTLMPGRFQVSSDGRRVAYVEKISRNRKEADNIFIAEQEKNGVDVTGTPWIVLSAKNGYQTLDPETHEPFVVATDGYRYAGTPGQNDYRIIQFQKYAIRTPDASLDTQRLIEEAIPTYKLLQEGHSPREASELQWRLSIPFSAFLLALLAIPLSQVKPRQGRYATLLTAILLYVVYMNLLFAGRNLIEQKIVVPWVGLFWVHALVLMVIMGLLWRTRRS